MELDQELGQHLQTDILKTQCNTAQRKQSTNADKFNKVIKTIIQIIFLMINSSDIISQFYPIIVH